MPEQVQYELGLSGLTREQEFRQWADTRGGRFLLGTAYRMTYPYARRFLRTGQRVSVRLVWELMRDRLSVLHRRAGRAAIRLEKVGGFSLNDHFHAYLARHILAHKPDWAGLFELREVGATRKPKGVAIVPLQQRRTA